MFSRMTLPTKENPSNSVRYSARSPRRMAMQYITKPEARTTPASTCWPGVYMVPVPSAAVFQPANS